MKVKGNFIYIYERYTKKEKKTWIYVGSDFFVLPIIEFYNCLYKVNFAILSIYTLY